MMPSRLLAPHISESRFGFAKDWLYFSHAGALYRFGMASRFLSEKRSSDGSWTPMDIYERDALYVPMEDARNWMAAEEVGCARGVFWDKNSGQGWLPHSQGQLDRRGIFGVWHWRKFFSSMPSRFKVLLETIHCDPFSALEFLSETPEAADLIKSDPQLAAALARHWEFPAVAHRDWDAVRRQLSHRRRDILGWLGFPAKENLVNALRKLFFDPYKSADWIQKGLKVLADPVFGPVIARAPHVHEPVVDFFSNPLTKLWLDIPTLKQSLPELNDRIENLFEPINLLMASGRIDAEGARKLSRRNIGGSNVGWLDEYINDDQLPAGPTPIGGKGVVPITSIPAMIKEGRAMHHCIGSFRYVMEAVRGRIAIYCVTEPIRATLCLRRNEEKNAWYVEEIRGEYNDQVRVEVLQTVMGAFRPVEGVYCEMSLER